MNIWKYLLAALVLTVLTASAASVAQGPLALDLRADEHNPSAPVMGDHLRFWSTITNAGTEPIEGLVAWISLVEIALGVLWEV